VCRGLVHSGIMPRDRDASVDLLMASVWPFYVECCKELHGFDLHEALIVELGEQVRFAEEGYRMADSMPEIREEKHPAISTLVAHVRWMDMYSNVPDGAENSLVGNCDEGWSRINKEVKRIEGGMNNPWSTECPVCEVQLCFVVDLDYDALQKREVLVNKAVCANCGHAFSEKWAFMANLVCGATLESEKEEILEMYPYEE
jgi:hypothetical protein